MVELKISDRFKTLYPDVRVGILAIRNLGNVSNRSALEEEKSRIIRDLQDQFPDRQQIRDHPVIQAYSSYYKPFGKTYHLIGQVETAVKNKSADSANHPAVEAMFLAELKNLLLTAGHDLGCIKGALEITAAEGTETYTSISGREVMAKEGDMLIRDEKSPISTVIYGPDRRTRITKSTNDVIYTVYVPRGIPAKTTMNLLDDISRLISLVHPSAETAFKRILP